MTTEIHITACCGDDKEVVVRVEEDGFIMNETVIQNGENDQEWIYDGRTVIVRERLKRNTGEGVVDKG